MANSDIMVRAEARKLFQKTGDERLAEYKKMPIADLQKVISAIDSGAKGTAKGPAAKGAKGATAKKGAATTAAEPAKVSQKGAKAKNAKKGTASSVKSAPAEKSAKSSAKGATGKAKRPATTVKAKSNGKVAKGVATKLRKSKGKFHIPKTYQGETLAASNGTGRVTKNPKRGEAGFRAPLDREAIDWTAPWNGGQRGSRGVVLEALREHEGDYEGVYKALKRRAAKLYANVNSPIGGTPETHLKWHIARTAFDFALGTGQHAPGTRVPNGQSTRRQDVKKRSQRSAGRKRTSAPKRGSASKGKKTKAKARKGSAGRTSRRKGTSKKGR